METETKPLALTYAQFLERKIDVAPLVGLDVQADQISPALKPHQRDSVLWALRGGRRALFAAFGLGYLQEAEAERDAPTLFDLIGGQNHESACSL